MPELIMTSTAVALPPRAAQEAAQQARQEAGRARRTWARPAPAPPEATGSGTAVASPASVVAYAIAVAGDMRRLRSIGRRAYRRTGERLTGPGAVLTAVDLEKAANALADAEVMNQVKETMREAAREAERIRVLHAGELLAEDTCGAVVAPEVAAAAGAVAGLRLAAAALHEQARTAAARWRSALTADAGLNEEVEAIRRRLDGARRMGAASARREVAAEILAEAHAGGWPALAARLAAFEHTARRVQAAAAIRAIAAALPPDPSGEDTDQPATLLKRVRQAQWERAERARDLAGRLRTAMAGAPSQPAHAGLSGGGPGAAETGGAATGFLSPSGEVIPDPTVSWLRKLIGYRVLSPAFEAELNRRMGTDPFGLRHLPPAPAFLAAVDAADLPAEHVAALLRRISLTRKAPDPGDLTPAALADDPGPVSHYRRTPGEQRWDQPRGAPLLPEDTRIPRIVHGIWLGGPIPEHAAIRTSFANAARRYQADADIVVWTDISRSAVEAADNAPPALPGHPDPHAAVRHTVNWARTSGIHLINVHEVFHAGFPMTTRVQYAAENAKQVPRGYACASDHLRLEIIYRFGGIYLDGDNDLTSTSASKPLTGTITELLDSVAASAHAFAPHILPIGANNDLIVAPARHPAILLWLHLARTRYLLTHKELFGGLEQMTQHFAGHKKRLLRYSVVYRSGRVHHALLAALKLRSDDPRLVRADQAVRYGSELSWSRSTVPQPPAPPDPAQVTAILARVITTLARQLIARHGDLHLTAVDPVIAALPDPDAAWTATLTILAELIRAEAAPCVTSITQFRRDDDGNPHLTILPPEAEALIDRTAAPGNWLGASLAQPGRPAWLLDEAVTPARLRSAPAPARKLAWLLARSRPLSNGQGTTTGLLIPADPSPSPGPGLPGYAVIYLTAPNGHPTVRGHVVTPESLALLLRHHNLDRQPVILTGTGEDPAALQPLARYLGRLLREPVYAMSGPLFLTAAARQDRC